MCKVEDGHRDRRSSARDTFIAESVYFVLNSLTGRQWSPGGDTETEE